MISESSAAIGALGTVTRLWRYPVKSMRGEQITSAAVDRRGLVGDRRFAVVDAEGKLGSCKNTQRFRRMDGLLDFQTGYPDDPAEAAASAPVLTGPSGTRHPVPSAEAQAAVRAHLGRQDVTIEAEAEVPHHDAAPLHVVSTATLDWFVQALQGVPADERRMRPNLVVHLPGAQAFAEDAWAGRRLRIGARDDAVVVQWVKPTERCRTVNAEQDDLPYTSQALKVLVGRGMELGVYLEVLTGGRVRVGDPVAFLD
jgi:uncharacterized protein YcbX